MCQSDLSKAGGKNIILSSSNSNTNGSIARCGCCCCRYQALFNEMKRVLKPTGKLVLRVFCQLEETPNIETLLRGKDLLKFHAFKLSISTALANPFVSVKEIQKHVKQVWNHPTLQFNRDSNAVYYFPKVSELPAFTDIQYPGTYQLANQCPIITWNYEKLFKV